MDPYISEFIASSIKTENIETPGECNTIFKVNRKNCNFKIIHINIRSFFKNFPDLEILLNEFTDEFHCIVLSETREVNVDLVKLKGYKVVYNEGTVNQNDGVIMFIHESLNFTYEINKIGQIKIINTAIQFQNTSITIIGIYRPPSINTQVFLQQLDEFMENTKFKSAITIFTGDLNINILQNNAPVTEYLNIMTENGFISLINDKTRIFGNDGSCIDHMFYKSGLNLDDFIIPVIIKTHLTDHFPIASQFVLKNEVIDQKNNYKLTTITNYKTINRYLEKIDWISFFDGLDCEDAATKLTNLLSNLLEQNKKVIKFKNKINNKKPWITKSILNSIQHRNNLCKLYNKTKNEDAKNEYTAYRKQLNKVLHTAKNNYFKNKIENSNDNKQMWNTISEIKNNGKSKTTVAKLEYANKTYSNNNEISEIFNQYFAGVGHNLASKFKKKLTFTETKKINTYTMFLNPTDSTEVYNIILKMKNKKSVGIDKISVDFLKKVSHNISYPLASIINQCFLEGTCPAQFKSSVVTPIHKKGDTTDPTNYRPISLINNTAKIFEKILKLRLQNFVFKHKIISEMQFGFQPKKSTQDAITELVDKIYKSLDRSKPSLCIFLDLAKAFDTVDHKKLITLLEEAGIRGTPLKLFESYLNGRQQHTKVGSSLSTPKALNCGVPQGTILGPILFIIYLNNLFNLNTSGKIVSFADDTAVYYEDTTWQNLKRKAELDFLNIKNWFDEYKLTLNVEKTNFMTFTNYKDSIPDLKDITIKQHNSAIKISSTYTTKYLGIHLDQHLKWNIHVNELTKKIRRIMYYFRFLKPILSIKQLKIVYSSLIESQIRYAILGWGGAMNNVLNNLIITQKRTLKIIHNKKLQYPTEELYKIAKTLDPRQLFYMTNAIKLYEIKKSYKNTTHNLRQTKQLTVPHMTKTIGQRSSFYLGPKIFNSLPSEIKESQSISVFKKNCKNYLLKNNRIKIHQLIDPKNAYFR